MSATGKTLYGTIEVKEGLSIDDAIAFPMENVKEGAKTIAVYSEYADDEDDNSSGMENYDSGMDNIDGENYDEGSYDEGSFEEGSYEEGALRRRCLRGSSLLIADVIPASKCAEH